MQFGLLIREVRCFLFLLRSVFVVIVAAGAGEVGFKVAGSVLITRTQLNPIGFWEELCEPG